MFIILGLLRPKANAWNRLIDAGMDAYRVGDLDRAERTLESARSLLERRGVHDLRLGKTLNNLAMVYHAQAKYHLVEPLLRKSIEIYERILGCKHCDLSGSLNNLAEFCHTLRKI